MEKKKKLPVYNLIITEGDDATEINFISLVEDPAIEIDYYTFSKEATSKVNFKIQDAEKQMIAGCLMVPNMPIYRRDPQTDEEYYVVMSEQTIENAVKKFAKKGFNVNINANHSTDVPGAFLMENWIISDPKNDKSNTFGFSNLVKGSWFGIVYLESEAWAKYIKSGELKTGGFSVEGIFSTGEIVDNISMSSDDEFLSFIADILLDNKFKL